MMMQKNDPKESALRELLDMVVKAGLLDSLEMPSEDDGLTEEVSEEMEPEEDMAEGEYEGDPLEEIEEKPVSLSITQLGAAKRPMPKKAVMDDVKSMMMSKKQPPRGKRRGR